MKRIACWIALVTGVVLHAHAQSNTNAPAIAQVRMIWDGAPHNAFTDLTRFQNRWVCVFREGKGHVSPDGVIRVLSSADGSQWVSMAVIKRPDADLRDPKLFQTPGGRLHLLAAGAWHSRQTISHQTFVWTSADGRTWSEPVAVGDPNIWLWRVTWERERGYGIGYSVDHDHFVRLYSSPDGFHFNTVVPRLFAEGQPNESAIVFEPAGRAVCLLRRDGQPSSGLLGTATVPFRQWTWKDLGVKIGGPMLARLPDGRFLAAVRLYDGGPRTSLAWVEVESGKLSECLNLPSGGDTSYAGLVWHQDQCWISYYSSHEGRSKIYLARVSLPPRR